MATARRTDVRTSRRPVVVVAAAELLAVLVALALVVVAVELVRRAGGPLAAGALVAFGAGALARVLAQGRRLVEGLRERHRTALRRVGDRS
jgi:hypothetical protein